MYETAEKVEIGKWKDPQKIIDYLICNAGKAMVYMFYPTFWNPLFSQTIYCFSPWLIDICQWLLNVCTRLFSPVLNCWTWKSLLDWRIHGCDHILKWPTRCATGVGGAVMTHPWCTPSSARITSLGCRWPVPTDRDTWGGAIDRFFIETLARPTQPPIPFFDFNNVWHIL